MDFLDKSIDIKQFGISNRRYIGNKNKLMPWINKLIHDNTEGTSFFDVFAGTGSVTNWELSEFDTLHTDSILMSEFVYARDKHLISTYGIDEFAVKMSKSSDVISLKKTPQNTFTMN